MDKMETPASNKNNIDNKKVDDIDDLKEEDY